MLGEPDAAEGVARIVGRDAKPIEFVNGFGVGVAASAGDPNAVTGAQDGLDGGDEAAGRYLPDDVFAVAHVDVGFAVGDDEDAAVAGVVTHVDGQTLRSPKALAGFAQSRLSLSCGTSAAQAFGHGVDFVSERREEAEILCRGLGGAHGMPGADSAHALDDTRQGLHEEPSNHSESDGRDEYDKCEEAPEAASPDAVRFTADKARVSDKDERAGELIAVVQGKVFFQPLQVAAMIKGADDGSLAQGPIEGCAGECVKEIVWSGKGEHATSRIVDNNLQSRGVAFGRSHEERKRAGVVQGKSFLNGRQDAQPHPLSAPDEFLTEDVLVREHIKISGGNRNQRDACNERQNQAQTKLVHGFLQLLIYL